MLLKNDFLFFLIFRENDESVNKYKIQNKKKLSHLSLYDLFLSLIIEGSEKGSIYHMIKQNQTYLNRLHVVMDAVCIYFAGFAAWYIRFKCTIFGFWLNQEIFDLNRYYPEFYQYQKPLISSLILLLLLYSFFGLYTPKRYQRGSKELVNLVKANLIGLGLCCICDHCMADSELSSFFISVILLFNFILVFYPDISYAGF